MWTWRFRVIRGAHLAELEKLKALERELGAVEEPGYSKSRSRSGWGADRHPRGADPQVCRAPRCQQRASCPFCAPSVESAATSLDPGLSSAGCVADGCVWYSSPLFF